MWGRENLASLMDHKKSTADKFYFLKTKTTSAVQTSKYLSKLMHGGKSSKADESGKAANNNIIYNPIIDARFNSIHRLTALCICVNYTTSHFKIVTVGSFVQLLLAE
jgi:hypothetical protein